MIKLKTKQLAEGEEYGFFDEPSESDIKHDLIAKEVNEHFAEDNRKLQIAIDAYNKNDGKSKQGHKHLQNLRNKLIAEETAMFRFIERGRKETTFIHEIK